MRRRSPQVRRADELLDPELAGPGALDPERVIGLLEPLVTEERRARIQRVLDDRLDSVTVVLDAPHDPHNGAAVVRSCDAFGVQRLFVLERYEPFLLAASVSRGTQKWVDVDGYRDVEPLVAAVRGRGHELVATAPDGELGPDDLASIGRFALVVGNEREGIAPLLRAACTRSVRVPMRGFVESLNLSVCTAILLSAATRGRPGDLPAAEKRRLYARGLFLSVPRAKDIVLGR
jgi:tRNA (guanosine-2'-O-)-methyltransferase